MFSYDVWKSWEKPSPESDAFYRQQFFVIKQSRAALGWRHWLLAQGMRQPAELQGVYNPC